MKKVSYDISLLDSNGTEEIGSIPADLMEQYMVLRGIKSRSKKAIEAAAIGLVSTALEFIGGAKKESKKKAKKPGKKIK